MYTNKADIRVRYAETDQMGIVHHSNYFVWFEVGRTECIEVLGLSYQQLEDMGMMLPLVTCSCKFIEPAKYPEHLEIHTWVESIKAAKMVFGYHVIRKSDQKVLARGETVHGIVDNHFNILNVKKAFPKIYQKIHALTQ